MKHKKFIVTTILLFIFILIPKVFAQDAKQETPPDKQPIPKPDSEIKLEISVRDGISRNNSPIMIDLLFKNPSYQPQKLCTYKFYDALLKLDIKDGQGKKVNFNPKLLQLQPEKISDKDWVNIPQGRVYKKSFSLTRKIIDATGYKLKPGNYSIKATYEGCSKFDPNISPTIMQSNLLYILVTD